MATNIVSVKYEDNFEPKVFGDKEYYIIQSVDIVNKTITLNRTIDDTEAVVERRFYVQPVLSGTYAHIEGAWNHTSGRSSHVEGEANYIMSSYRAHVEGGSNKILFYDDNTVGGDGSDSHVEGFENTLSGNNAHAEGTGNTALGQNSHVEGSNNTSTHLNQHIFGTFNVLDTSTARWNQQGTYVEIVGNGNGKNNRSNARTLDWSGNEWLAGTLKIGGTGYNDSNAKEVATINSGTITLTTSGWSNNTQTVSSSGVTTTNLVQVSPDPTSLKEYGSCGVYCSAQGTDSLTFTCDTVPTNNLTVNVVVWG